MDFRAVENTIRDLCDRFDVRQIAFDPQPARNTLDNRRVTGSRLSRCRQGWIAMAPRFRIGGSVRQTGGVCQEHACPNS